MAEIEVEVLPYNRGRPECREGGARARNIDLTVIDKELMTKMEGNENFLGIRQEK